MALRLKMGKHRKQRKKKKDKRKPPPKGKKPMERIDIDMSELEAILDRAKAALSEEEYEKIHGALETLVFLTQELEKKRVSVQRLKEMLFGAATEKTKKVLEKVLEESGEDPGPSKEEQTESGEET